MSVLQQMKDMLSPLGIYSLEDESLVMYELRVYASQFEKLHEELATMLREFFISTAQSYGIEKIEELFQRVRPDLSMQERKERISRYMTLCNTDFYCENIESQLRLAGIFAEFTQDCEAETLSFPELIALSDIVETARQLNIIEDIVPAHLNIDVGIVPLCWDDLDSLDFNFGTIDSANLRFDLFDE